MHETVLLNEAVRALITKPSGSYIDGTFGRGGHSKAILKKLSPEGNLLAVDRDPEAIICARKIAEEDSRLKVYKGLFSDLSLKAEAASQVTVDGILLDLGEMVLYLFLMMGMPMMVIHICGNQTVYLIMFLTTILILILRKYI